MYTSLITIILVSIVIPAGDTVLPSAQNYRVSEIVGVLSADSFQCKLSNYELAPSVRFQVFLPKAEGVTEETLSELLNSSKQIELRNVQFRSYFRVEADLWLDGELFLKKRDREPIPQKGSDSFRQRGVVDGSLPKMQSWQQLQRPQESDSPRVTVQRFAVTIEELLETDVDCSMLTDETPLSDALTFLAKSVQPHLPLMMMWNDLEYNAAIEKETPIGVSGMGRMTLRQALTTIARSVSAGGPRLILVKGGGFVTLRTSQALLKDKSTRVYDVRDLVAPPSTGDIFNRNGSGSGGGFSNMNNLAGLANRGGYFGR